MKSFPAYFIFSVLLVICYCERQRSCPPPDTALEKPLAASKLFPGKFASNGGPSKIPSFQMRLHIHQDFIQDSYRPANSKTNVDIFGAVNNPNELLNCNYLCSFPLKDFR
ncbi:hypothetical protein [Dyadobacter arcticus]|uniref:Uncharacterized protein n=1 Tax=Dyadobacter arcticus TaxID=1078754 RepID=A0ABX0UEX0_9BACT|nr:hypothetical protein [Dyadobacter arcticus]NIJ51544.1 hypothetical protein [Dyadobacter arcticus]